MLWLRGLVEGEPFFLFIDNFQIFQYSSSSNSKNGYVHANLLYIDYIIN